MRDLPTSLDLMTLARRLLLDDILPFLPEARQRDIHLVATSMAIAAREAGNGDGPLREIAALLSDFYGDAALHPGLAALLRRLAADLRAGAFETSESREPAARAILWRLTILKLREGNPHFLAAHGIV